MAREVELIDYWKPSLTEADVEHLRALGLYGGRISGNPYKSHLKRLGEALALCGAAPGSGGRTRKMANRAGWRTYTIFESPGCEPCEACLKAAEDLSAPTQQVNAG